MTTISLHLHRASIFFTIRFQNTVFLIGSRATFLRSFMSLLLSWAVSLSVFVIVSQKVLHTFFCHLVSLHPETHQIILISWFSLSHPNSWISSSHISLDTCSVLMCQSNQQLTQWTRVLVCRLNSRFLSKTTKHSPTQPNTYIWLYMIWNLCHVKKGCLLSTLSLMKDREPIFMIMHYYSKNQHLKITDRYF